MKKEEKKPFIQCCILGAIGGILMAAGDWLLGCVPLQKTDTGMFNRACYLSGAYALWKPALVVGMGALGCFLCSFMVKALNADIDAKCKKTKAIQYFCGLFAVVVALAIHLWAALLWRGFPHLSGAAYRSGDRAGGSYRLPGRDAPRSSSRTSMWPPAPASPVQYPVLRPTGGST